MKEGEKYINCFQTLAFSVTFIKGFYFLATHNELYSTTLLNNKCSLNVGYIEIKERKGHNTCQML